MKKPNILLCNWTHRHNIIGGTESRYAYLKQVFPDAELISYEDLFGKKKPEKPRVIEKIDKYYLKRYKENKNILLIRDAEVGGVLDITKIPQITIFANPYRSIKKLFGQNIKYDECLLSPKSVGKKVATSNFMKEDMKLCNLYPDEIISNPVDIDFFKPLWNKKEELRKKYKIPRDKKVGIWVGSTNMIKNFQMITQMVDIFDNEIFWILVAKNETGTDDKRVKVFCNVDRNTIRDLYNCADFFILTSPIEGYGNAIFEAMACNLPCIVSPTGYFYDFWDNRVGFRIQWNDILVHIGAIKMIDKIKANPRQVIIDKKLDLKTWGEKWKKLVEEF